MFESYIWIFIAAGVVLLSAASIGGGFEVKEIRIPKLNWFTRLLTGILGLAFIIFAIVWPVHPEAAPPVIDSFRADPGRIRAGESSLLSWNVSDALSVNIQPSIGPVSLSSSRTVPATKTMTYVLTATNDYGTVEERVIIQVIHEDAPVISSFQADPQRITAGESSSLSWGVTNATTVIIEPEIGSVPLSGTRTIFATETKTYTLTATSDAGEVSTGVTVSVDAPEPPVITDFRADPERIPAGEKSRLIWSVSGAKEVVIEPSLGDVPHSGEAPVEPSETVTYHLVAVNEDGESRDEVIVQVEPIRLPNIISFRAEPNKITVGESSILRWSVTGVTTVTIEPDIGEMPHEGEAAVEPLENATYTLVAQNDRGKDRAVANVWVVFPVDYADVDPDMPLLENCTHFDPDRLRVDHAGPIWRLVAGALHLENFSNREEALRTLETIRHYGITSLCVAGYPGRAVEYFLVDGQAPDGAMLQETCIPFNPFDLRAGRVGDEWWLLGLPTDLMKFPSEEEARQMIAVFKKYRFSAQCWVGPAERSMTYFRK